MNEWFVWKCVQCIIAYGLEFHHQFRRFLQHSDKTTQTLKLWESDLLMSLKWRMPHQKKTTKFSEWERKSCQVAPKIQNNDGISRSSERFGWAYKKTEHNRHKKKWDKKITCNVLGDDWDLHRIYGERFFLSILKEGKMVASNDGRVCSSIILGQRTWTKILGQIYTFHKLCHI